jgi:hypothetical protein
MGLPRVRPTGTRLARLRAGIVILGVFVMVPGIAWAITSGEPAIAA